MNDKILKRLICLLLFRKKLWVFHTRLHNCSMSSKPALVTEHWQSQLFCSFWCLSLTQWLLIRKGLGSDRKRRPCRWKPFPAPRMLTSEEGKKGSRLEIFETYFAEEPVWCKWHTRAYTCTLFPETFTSSTHRRWSPNQEQSGQPCFEPTSFGGRRFFVRQAPNHNLWENPQPEELPPPPRSWWPSLTPPSPSPTSAVL